MKAQIRRIATTENPLRRKALESKLAELRALHPGLDEIQVEYLADPLDLVRLSSDREVAVQQLASRTRLINEVHSALSKLDEGVYGICEECESQIAPKRLDVLPWARLCMSCQSIKESNSGEIVGVLKAAA
jgi:RNA polymerase-binding transcription factor